MEITASMVKDLRDKTGAGILDAKKALTETNGDIQKAMDYLRQKGIASADKKMSRIAAEGLIASFVENNVGAMIEVNCETDFVAKTDEFKEMVSGLAQVVTKTNPTDVAALNATTCEKCGEKIEDVIKNKIAKIGEKMTIRRFVRFAGNSAAAYVHNGKIGVLLEYKGNDEALAKDICLHIASCAPQFATRDEVPADFIESERKIEMQKEDILKKPENIREKIVEGRINKMLAERCLLEQAFVKNPDETVKQLIEGKIEIVKFERWTLGEGLEKRQENFADEVNAQLNK